MKIGEIVKGKIVNIKNYGIFIELDDGSTALCHISEISKRYINNIFRLFSINQTIYAKIISIDKKNNFVNLTIKGITKEERKIFENIDLDFSKLESNVNLMIKNYMNKEKKMKINTNYLLDRPNYKKYEDKVRIINQMINSKTGLGNDFLGWTTWPKDYDKNEFERILEKAKYVRDNFDVLVVCGIGGSYLGARAAIEAINGLKSKDKLEIIYLGQTFSTDYIYDTLEYLKNKRFAINVISKSGTTTETSVSFRLLKELLESKIGKDEARRAIIATTDKEKGALKELSNKEGYETYILPDDIGGRYSVLTAVGLFPIACAGIDIKSMMDGAYDAMIEFDNDDLYTNSAYQYAVYRHHLYENGKQVEMFVCYEPHLVQLNEWLKQLFGESEGKEGKGLLPASASFTTDLHSMGQFIQEGTHNLFETIIYFKNPKNIVTVPHDEDNLDGLNYLEGKTLSHINEKAFLGTLDAHANSGKVNNIVLEFDKITPYAIGYLFYFFMRVCAMSAYLLEINPFNQPGVEVYKKNMFHLLGKKGY